MAAPELKTLGRYTLERVLGKGAMGVVYEGFDPRLNRRVAIKTILKSNLDEDTAKDFAMRFVREAQAVARLNHPNIVQVHDFGDEGEIAYIVMEFIRGRELKTFFDANERFDLKEAVRIMGELCEALEFAHQAGIVHRDIKPANVMIDSQARTKLTDFGVARVQDVGRTQATQAGTMVGTPAYMSPEQITGGTIDKRTDVFSAGIILYQFLTGVMPFGGGGVWTIAKKIMQDDPPRPSSVNTSVTPLFDAVVNKALAKDPANRYQSARGLGIGLKRALEGKADEDESDKTIVRTPAPAPKPAAPADKAAATQPGVQDAEVEFWRSIKDASDPGEFEFYLRKFPNGVYAELAGHKVAKLRGGAREETGLKAKQPEEQKPDAGQAKREAAAPAKRHGAVMALAIGVVMAAIGTGVWFAMNSPTTAPAADKAAAEKLAQDNAAAGKLAAEKTAAEKTAEEKARALAQIKEEEERRKAEIVAKKEAEAKAETRRKAEEQAKADALARKEAEEKAKAEAARKAEEARLAALRPGHVFRDCPDCPEMVVIPPGSYQMGGSRQITIAHKLAVGKTEVTFAQWDACVADGGCGGYRPDDRGWGRGSQPVMNVSWDDAKQYVAWISRKTGKTYRLLTEAEWEYAARAGTTTAYYWGDSDADICQYASVDKGGNACGAARPGPVGTRRANPFGLHDMLGSMWEWVEDCWNSGVDTAPSDGSARTSGNCALRVLRGGSWFIYPSFARSAYRSDNAASSRYYSYGLRVARTN